MSGQRNAALRSNTRDKNKQSVLKHMILLVYLYELSRTAEDLNMLYTFAAKSASDHRSLFRLNHKSFFQASSTQESSLRRPSQLSVSRSFVNN